MYADFGRVARAEDVAVPDSVTANLPSLRLGPLAIEFPVVQSPLSGYSDWPMRVIARRLGAAYTVCEVMLDQFILNVTKGRKTKRFLYVSDDEHPCGAQLMGAVPEQFPPAALKLVEAGFDVIDLNFACPVKKVLGRCRGGFLLSDPATALAIVGRVRDALPPGVPLTVKMRRGMDDSVESRDRFYTIFEGAFRLGAVAVTVHGRTVRQRYEGLSSREFLAEVKRHAGQRTVLGSGDLFAAQDCLDMFRQTGVDGVSVARGAIGNPWIFEQVRALATGVGVASAEPAPAARRDRRALSAGRGNLRSQPLLSGDAQVWHQIRPPAPARTTGPRCLRGGYGAERLAFRAGRMVCRRPAGRAAFGPRRRLLRVGGIDSSATPRRHPTLEAH